MSSWFLAGVVVWGCLAYVLGRVHGEEHERRFRDLKAEGLRQKLRMAEVKARRTRKILLQLAVIIIRKAPHNDCRPQGEVKCTCWKAEALALLIQGQENTCADQ